MHAKICENAPSKLLILQLRIQRITTFGKLYKIETSIDIVATSQRIPIYEVCVLTFLHSCFRFLSAKVHMTEIVYNTRLVCDYFSGKCEVLR